VILLIEVSTRVARPPFPLDFIIGAFALVIARGASVETRRAMGVAKESVGPIVLST